jgi:glycosyltransferase involved in cell wall biosynthesis
MSSKLLTILVPTYNRASYLKKTLDSLLPFVDIAEILVINDGGEACNLDESKVRLVNLSKNVGEASVVNLGWKLARTDLFTVISDDDPQSRAWLDPIIKAAKENPEIVAFYPSNRVFNFDGTVSLITAQKYDRDTFLKLLRSPCLAGVLINRRLLMSQGVEEIRIDGMNYPSDLIQWLELSKFGQFLGVNLAFGQWHKHKNQTTELLSKIERSKAFYRNVSTWQTKNLDKRELPDAYAITFLRSLQIGLTPGGNSIADSIRAFRIIITLHLLNLKNQRIGRLVSLKSIIGKIIDLANFKVKNA